MTHALGKPLGENVPPDTPAWLTPAAELDVIRGVSILRAQRRCLTMPAVGDPVRVERQASDDGARARLVNVLPCGLATCPNCARRIRIAKSVEVEHLIGQLLNTRRELCGVRSRREMVMLTLTARHHRRESLQRVLDRVNGGVHRLMSGRRGDRWRKLGLEIVCRSVEVTYGANGWHPHVHMIVALTPLPLGDAMSAQAQRWDLLATMQDAWLQMVDGEPGIAFQYEPIQRGATGEIARYVAGVAQLARGAAMEAVRHDLKHGRSESVGAFQLAGLLARARRGETVDIGGKIATADRITALWNEWEAAMRGVHQVALGRGFKELRLTSEQTAERVASLAATGARDDAWEAVREISRYELHLMRLYGVAPVLAAAAGEGLLGMDRTLDAYRARWHTERGYFVISTKV